MLNDVPGFSAWPCDLKPPLLQLGEMVVHGQIDFSQLSSEGVSDIAQDFLQCLLVKDQDERISAAQALQHPWVRDIGHKVEEIPLNGTAVQRLQRHAVSSHLKQLVLKMITDDLMGGYDDFNLSHSVLDPLRNIFSLMGSDELGSVSCETIKVKSDFTSLQVQIFFRSQYLCSESNLCPKDELAREGYYLSDVERQQLLDCIDFDGDGLVAFDEFASCMLDWHAVQQSMKWETLVRHAFIKLDLNGDGVLSVEEVVALLPDNYVDPHEAIEVARSMVRDSDKNFDGVISWEEFFALVSNGNSPNSLDVYDSRLSTSYSLSGSLWDLQSLGSGSIDERLPKGSGKSSSDIVVWRAKTSIQATQTSL